MNNKIGVYIKVDSNKVITEINSSIFLNNMNGYVFVDEGVGDKYAHAQSQYLENGIIDSQGRYNYKYVDNILIELTEEEKKLLFPTLLPQQSFEDTQNDINIDTDYRLSIIELGV